MPIKGPFGFEIYEHDCDTLRSIGFPAGTKDANTYMDYARFIANSILTTAGDTAMYNFMPVAMARLKRGLDEVRAGAESGEAGDVLEWGIRLFLGFGGLVKDKDAAVAQWQRLVDSSQIKRVQSPPSQLLTAQACSCIAHYYEQKSRLPNDILQIDDLRRAAEAGDTAAGLGLVTPTVWTLSIRIGNIGFPGSLWAVPCFTRLGELRRVHERMTRGLEDAGKAHQQKLECSPDVYRCAAPGCRIEATKWAALRKCGGACTEPHKPRYCSRQCQVQDWKRHKPYCRPGVVAPSAASEGVTMKSNEQALDLEDQIRRPDPKKQYVIRVPASKRPDDIIEFTSSTIPPTLLRQVRDDLEKAQSE